MPNPNESRLLKRKYRLQQSNLPHYPEKFSSLTTTTSSSSQSSSPSSTRSSTPDCYQSSLPLIISSLIKKDKILRRFKNECKKIKEKNKTQNEDDDHQPQEQNRKQEQEQEQERKKQQQKYEYKKLNEIQEMFPLSSDTLICLYGIIVSYNEEGMMTIKDETFERFRFYPNLPTKIPYHKQLTTTIEPIFDDECDDDNDDDEIKILSSKENDNNNYTFKTGDIIRVHRLALNRNLIHRSRSSKNIVIFESFNDRDKFHPITLAEKPTIESYDYKRLDELNKWQIEILLNNPSSQSLYQNRECEIINCSLLVWYVKNFDKKTVICCWTPSIQLIEKHPCYTAISLNNILTFMINNNDNLHTFSKRIIERIYVKKQLIFLIIFGKHRQDAMNLNCCDTIIVNEIIRKPDNFYPGHYSYILHDNTTYGQCIRRAHPNSLIAKKMQDKIIDYIQNPPDILEMDRLDDFDLTTT